MLVAGKDQHFRRILFNEGNDVFLHWASKAFPMHGTQGSPKKRHTFSINLKILQLGTQVIEKGIKNKQNTHMEADKC